MLLKMGLQPDGIVGHSVGELACGYADGSLSHSEALQAAYWRGKCIKEANLPPGGMAAVGKTTCSGEFGCEVEFNILLVSSIEFKLVFRFDLGRVQGSVSTGGGPSLPQRRGYGHYLRATGTLTPLTMRFHVCALLLSSPDLKVN